MTAPQAAPADRNRLKKALIIVAGVAAIVICALMLVSATYATTKTEALLCWVGTILGAATALNQLDVS